MAKKKKGDATGPKGPRTVATNRKVKDQDRTTWHRVTCWRKLAEITGEHVKRGDRVLTVGGMLGTVQEVREDSIVLKVDDVSGAKAHFTRGAIQQVIKSAKSDGKSEGGAVAEAG